MRLTCRAERPKKRVVAAWEVMAHMWFNLACAQADEPERSDYAGRRDELAVEPQQVVLGQTEAADGWLGL